MNGRAPMVRAFARALVPTLLAVFWTCAPGAAEPAAEATATRIVVLVRHGEYDQDDPRDAVEGRGLVPLGREQARLLGERLVREGWRFDSVHVSTLLRARQTADIVGQALGATPNVVADLSECTPPTRSEKVMKELEVGEAEACRAQLERVTARFLRPAHGAEARDLLVCHGNVIRYLVCRALGVDQEAWLNMRIANCGITEIEVDAKGVLRLVTFNDVGHLRPEVRTMTGRPAVAPAPR